MVEITSKKNKETDKKESTEVKQKKVDNKILM